VDKALVLLAVIVSIKISDISVATSGMIPSCVKQRKIYSEVRIMDGFIPLAPGVLDLWGGWKPKSSNMPLILSDGKYPEARIKMDGLIP
jgi:hypothetical protein